MNIDDPTDFLNAYGSRLLKKLIVSTLQRMICRLGTAQPATITYFIEGDWNDFCTCTVHVIA